MSDTSRKYRKHREVLDSKVSSSGLPEASAEFFGGPFAWLASAWDDDVWHIPGKKIGAHRRIYWRRPDVDAEHLSRTLSHSMVETLKRALVLYIEDPGGLFNFGGYESPVFRCRRLIAMAAWLAEHGVTTFRAVNEEHLRELVDALARRDLLGTDASPRETGGDDGLAMTDSALMEYFRSLQNLFELSCYRLADGSPALPEGLTVRPFSSMEEAAMLSRRLGRRRGEVIPIAPRQALALLDAAIQYVCEYSDDIFMLEDRRRMAQAKADDGEVLKSRLSPGGRAAVIAEFALEVLAGKQTVHLRDGKLARRELADHLGLDLSGMYRGQGRRITDELEAFLLAPSEKTKSALRRSCTELARQSPQSFTASGRYVSRQMGLPFTGRPGSAAPWPIVTVGSGPHSSVEARSLESALIDLWTAVFIVIGALMGDRLSEIINTDVNCLELSAPARPLFRNRSSKESGSPIGEEDVRPCPQVVVRAVQVAASLGAHARSAEGTSYLFMSEHRHGYSVPDETTIRVRMLEFARRAKVDVDASLSPHQLRRFFAIAFFWYFDDEAHGLLALQRHLRHSHLSSTAGYARMSALVLSRDPEGVNVTTKVLTDVAISGVELQGGLGNQISRHIDRLDIRVHPADEIGDRVRSLVERHGLMFVPSPFGFCGWSPSRAKFAECAARAGLVDPLAPAPAERSPGVCGVCANFCTHKGFSPFWQQAIRSHRKILAQPNVPAIVRLASEEFIAIASRYAGEVGRDGENVA